MSQPAVPTVGDIIAAQEAAWRDWLCQCGGTCRACVAMFIAPRLTEKHPKRGRRELVIDWERLRRRG